MPKKKRFIVVPRTQNAMLDGISTSKGKVNFKAKGPTYVDESVAGEIDNQHGLKGSGDVWVEQDERLEWHEHHDKNTDGRNRTGIHHYTFGQSDKYSEAWEEFMARRKLRETRKRRKSAEAQE